MLIKIIKHFNKLILCLPVLFCLSVSAQENPQSAIDRIVDSLRSYNQRQAIEKLYVQMDKPGYLNSDTLWFKAYLFDAASLSYARKSGLLYVELASDSNKVMKRIMLPVSTGITRGNIALNSKDFPGGTYTLRAYTSWMRNFGEDYIFRKQFQISDPEQNSWLVNSVLSLSKTGGKEQGKLSLRFRDLDKKDIGLRQIRLRVMNGRKIVFREDKETSLYGELSMEFSIPEQTDQNSLYLTAEDMRKGEGNRMITIPLPLNRPEKTDLQFMPEGGNLVAGLLSDVAFKAVAEDGRGTDISGKILDSKLQEILSFSSLHKGMGSFLLLPRAGESYLARVNLPGGGFRDYALPAVKPSGTALKVSNRLNSGSLEVTIQASPEMLSDNTYYYLTGQTNGVVHYGASVLLKQPLTRLTISKDLFSNGIARITLLNSAKVPLNERRVYIAHKDEELHLRVSTDKPSYGNRDSIGVEIMVSDSKGNPVNGSFSMAVTDDARVRTDTTDQNIISTLFLSSGLGGTVEDPAYYFRAADTAKAWQDLDLLLLTQGWVNYNWAEAFAGSKPFAFPAESEFIINGTVKNIFNKPAANTPILLFSKNPLVMIDTLTNDQGRFSFRNLPVADTAAYFIQSRNKRGKSFNVGIEVDEFIEPGFSALKQRFIPWFLNSDTVLLESTRNIVKELHRYDAPAGVNVLDEVVVTAKKIIKESHNKNGSGNADYILDEKDMQEAKRKTLYEVLADRFPDLRRGKGAAVRDTSSDTMRYVMMNRFIRLVIDGVGVREIGSTEEDYMEYITAEDITGIEIMESTKYAIAYDDSIMARLARCPSRGCPPPPVYLEVTTRSGNGAFMRKTPGVYLYKPLAYSFPDEFYRPRYLIREENPPLADMRSTIHWEPDIITDQEGKARVSFYSADQKGSYTLILEGADMAGRIGFKRKKIRIE